MYIRISVNNKIATLQDNCLIINGNSDYVIKFEFDAEWDAYETKTARFVTARGYTDVVFSGDEVALPVITDAISVRVGVYAGNLRTTTPAVIFCRRCITDGSGSPADPAPDVYAQIMERLNNLDGATPATADKLGVVKIGDNLKITEDGILSVDTADALDTTLTQSGKAADAKAVGDRLSALSEEIGTVPENVALLEDVTADEASGDFIPMLSQNGTEYRLSIGDDGVPVIKNANGATVWSGTSGGSSGGGDDPGGGGTDTTWTSGVPYTLTIIADEYIIQSENNEIVLKIK